MITVKFADLKGRYKILWLRYVYGVDLSQHCMKSLLGHNDKRVRGFMRVIPEMVITEEAPWYYLCGVDMNFVWQNNLHLAFRYSCGSVIELDNEFIRCRIENARQLEISKRFIDYSLPQSKNWRYNTCRNWWFANMIAKEDGCRQLPRDGALLFDT